MVNFNLEFHLRRNIFMLKILGMWPESQSHFSSIPYLVHTFFIHFIMVFLFDLALGVKLYFLTNDLETFTANGYVFLVCLLALVKGYYLIKKNHLMKVLVRGIPKDGQLELSLEQHQSMVELLDGWKIFQLFFSTINPFITSIIWGSYTIFDSSGDERKLPFPAWYPYDYTQNFVYQVTFVHQVLGILTIAWINGNVDTIMSGLMAYIAAECQVLGDVLGNLSEISQKLGNNFDSMNATLIYLIKRHKKIIEFSKEAESYFNSYLIFQFITSALSIAMTMFNMSVRWGTVEFVAISLYQVGVVLQLYNYCWYGNEVILYSASLPYAAYQCNWIDAPITFQKNLVYFIHRTQTPIRILAVDFIVLSLETFTSILRTAWSYYALLRQVSNKMGK